MATIRESAFLITLQFMGSAGYEHMPTMPTLRVFHVPGKREINNRLDIGTEPIKFFDMDDLNGADPPKSENDPLCVEEKVFYDMGVENGADYTQSE